MSGPGSVSVWIARLKAGDRQAVERLWEIYFSRLVRLARRRLARLPRALRDEEDVAVSAFDSFFEAAQGDCFPRLDDRHDLWQILVMLSARKARRAVKHEQAKKRGGGRVRHVSALAREDGAVLEVIGREPTPAMAAQVVEEYRRHMEALDDDDLRVVAQAKMEGRSNAEIAAMLDVVERTVERRLNVIRNIWSALDEAQE